jgi:AcrR family transcriptional regulator
MAAETANSLGVTSFGIEPVPQAEPAPVPRKLSREARRTQLIEATIDVLAERGFARTTLTDVANRAGLSHGLVNFHFQSKELLLTETLGHLADEYRENWVQALDAAEKTPQHQLNAMIRADFEPKIIRAAKLAAWISLWGEAQSRPMYQQRCGANDAAYITRKEAICDELMALGNYRGDPVRVARVLRVTSEGVWIDMATSGNPCSAEEGLRTVFCAAAAFFPNHFDDNGLLG